MRRASYHLQFALIFGLYAITCPVWGKEFYGLSRAGIKPRKKSLTIHFQDFKNSKSCGDKWKIVNSDCAEYIFLIDLAYRVFSPDRQKLLRGQTPCDSAFVTVTGQPFSESHWSSTVSGLIHEHVCTSLKSWTITVDVIRAAFITVFLNGNPSSHDVENVAFAMNTSMKMMYQIYDRFSTSKYLL